MEAGPTPEFIVEFARRGYEAYNKGGVDAILPFLEEDIEWINDHPVPMRGTYHGHAGVRRYFEELTALFEDLRLEPEEFIPIGNEYVLVFLRVRGRGVRTGVEGSQPVANLWKVGQQGAAQVRLFYDRAEALEAAGVEDPEQIHRPPFERGLLDAERNRR
jgi:ketosteroid isomerase-like protein